MASGDWHEHTTTDGSRSLTSVVDQTVPTLIIFTGVGLLLLDYSLFWVVFVVGFPALYPALRAFAQWYDSNHQVSSGATSTPSDDQALETLRNRYACGEIDEMEFEKQVENLLETESVADVRTKTTNSSATRSTAEPDPEKTRNRAGRDAKN